MDAEFAAMQKIVEVADKAFVVSDARTACREAVADLDEKAQARVIHWAADRYPWLGLTEADITPPQATAEIDEPEAEL